MDGSNIEVFLSGVEDPSGLAITLGAACGSSYLVVQNTAGSGQGSLLHAINCASTGDTISFSSVLQGDTIFITDYALYLNKNLNIIAETQDSIFILCHGLEQTFIVESSNVLIEGLHIISCNGSLNHAINNQGSLTLRNVQVYDDDGSSDSILIQNLGNLIIEGTTSLKQSD